MVLYNNFNLFNEIYINTQIINSVITTAIAAPMEPKINIKDTNRNRCKIPANITIFENFSRYPKATNPCIPKILLTPTANTTKTKICRIGILAIYSLPANSSTMNGAQKTSRIDIKNDTIPTRIKICFN